MIDWDDLGLFVSLGASLFAFAGYVTGWIVAIYGGQTPYFRRLAHKCAESGMTRNLFACYVGLRLAPFGMFVGAVAYGCAAFLDHLLSAHPN